MTMRTLSFSSLIAMLLLLTACGFQLRGNVDIPEGLKKLYIASEAKSTPTRPYLVRLLEANDVSIEPGMVSAAYQLTILNEDHERRAISLSSSAKTEEYELRSAITIKVTNSAGEVVIAPTELYTERVYRFDENNVNAAGAEEELLRKEMLNNLAQQVIRRYLAIAK